MNTTTRFAEIDIRVYESDADDARATDLQRALHSELCRTRRPHPGGNFTACERAERVVRKMQALGMDFDIQRDGMPK